MLPITDKLLETKQNVKKFGPSIKNLSQIAIGFNE